MQSVKADGGRFLRWGVGSWFEISDEEARKKTSQRKCLYIDSNFILTTMYYWLMSNDLYPSVLRQGN